MKKLIITIFLVCLITVTAYAADNYFVDNVAGNDGNSGEEPGAGNAWQTLQYAADNSVGGSTTWVKSGTSYTLSATCDYDTNNGSLAAPFVVAGFTTVTGDSGQATVTKVGGVNVLINTTLDYYEWKNLIVTGADTDGIYNSSASAYLKYTNLTVHNNGQDGIEQNGGAYFYIDQCEIYSNGQSGIETSSGLAVNSCYIHDNTGSGIDVDGSPAFFNNNIIEANGSWGLETVGYRGIIISNNVFDANTTGGIHLDGDFVASGIINNIISNHDTGGEHGILQDAGEYTPCALIDYNAYFNNDDDVDGVEKGANAVAVASNPYTTAGSVWTLNSTGGDACKNTGLPQTIINSATNCKMSIGAAQLSEVAASGSITFTGVIIK